MRATTWDELAKEIHEVNPGFTGWDFIETCRHMAQENSEPAPTLEQVWLHFLENRLDRQADGMDVGHYMVQYTTGDSEELESDYYNELQHAIVRTLQLAKEHQHPEFNLWITYCAYPNGDLTTVGNYDHQTGFNFVEEKLQTDY